MVVVKKFSALAVLSAVAVTGAVASLQPAEASHAHQHRGLTERHLQQQQQPGMIKVQKRQNLDGVTSLVGGILTGTGSSDLDEADEHLPNLRRGIVGDILGAGGQPTDAAPATSAPATTAPAASTTPAASNNPAPASSAPASSRPAASSNPRPAASQGGNSGTRTSGGSRPSSSPASNNNNSSNNGGSSRASNNSQSSNNNNNNQGSAQQQQQATAASAAPTDTSAAAAAASASAASAAASAISANSASQASQAAASMAGSATSTAGAASTTGADRGNSSSSSSGGSDGTVKVVVPIVVIVASIALIAVAVVLIRRYRRRDDEDDFGSSPVESSYHHRSMVGSSLAAGGAAFAVGGAAAGLTRDRPRRDSYESFHNGRPMSNLTEEEGEYSGMAPPMQEVSPYAAVGGAYGSARGGDFPPAHRITDSMYVDDVAEGRAVTPFSDEHGAYDVNYYDGSSTMGYNNPAARGMDAAGASSGAGMPYSPYADVQRGDAGAEGYYEYDRASSNRKDPFTDSSRWSS